MGAAPGLACVRPARRCSTVTVLGTRNAIKLLDNRHTQQAMRCSTVTGSTARRCYGLRRTSAALLYSHRVNSNAMRVPQLGPGTFDKQCAALRRHLVNSNAIGLLNQAAAYNKQCVAANKYRVNSNAISSLLDKTARTTSNALLYGDRVKHNAIGLLNQAGHGAATTIFDGDRVNRQRNSGTQYGCKFVAALQQQCHSPIALRTTSGVSTATASTVAR